MQQTPSSDSRGSKRYNNFATNILPLPPGTTQQFSKAEQMPPLPPHLSELTNQPWTKQNSLKLDWWMWYCQQEFEAVVGNE
jgi:hypothetical protein